MDKPSAAATDEKKRRRQQLDMQKLIIGAVLLLIFFAAGARFGDYLRQEEEQPTVAQVGTAPGMLEDDIKGAVAEPGVYQLPEDSRVEDALAAAGLLENAQTQLLNMAALLVDGTELIVPYADGDIDWNALAAERGGRYFGLSAAEGEGTTEDLVPLVNINTADADELQRLSGIGEVKAQRIIEHREQYGPFVTIEQIMNVAGIGEATFANIREQICVE